MEEKYNIESFIAISPSEHIRLRPKMYFEKCFIENSLDYLIFEILCHALDEYFDGKCKTIEIKVFKDSFRVKYDAGMSLKIRFGLSFAESIMSKIGACSNHKKHLSVGEEFCKLGMATINFASENCELTTVSKGQKGNFCFINGEIVSKEIIETLDKNEWTEIYLKPDKTIFGDIDFTSKGVTEIAERLQSKLNNLEFKIIDCII